MSVKVANNAFGTLAASITTVQTVISLTSGQGQRFPVLTSASDWFWATLVNAQNTIEVVKVTATSGDAFTVTRGQDGTTAYAYAAGDRVELRPTAALFNDKLGVVDAGATYATLSYANTTYLNQLTGGTVTGNVTVKAGNPAIGLVDTNATLPSGAWRMLSQNGNLYVARNTAGAGDFSAETTPLYVDQSDQAHFSVRPVFNGATPWDSSNAPNVATLGANQQFTGSNSFKSDIYGLSGAMHVYGNGGNTQSGVVFLTGNGAQFLEFDGSNYQMPNANLYVWGGLVRTSLNTTNLSQFNNDVGYVTEGSLTVNIASPRVVGSGYLSNVGLENVNNNTIRLVLTYTATDSGGGGGA